MPKTYEQTRDEMIKHFEESGKFNPNAYDDGTGKPTIGWGFTRHPDGRAVKMGDTMTAEVGDKHFSNTVNYEAELLRKLPNWKLLTDNQKAAVEAFGYNVGRNFLSSSNFRTVANAIKNYRGRPGDAEAVTNALQLYTNGGTPGLVRRRQAEAKLFNTPDPQKTPKATSAPLRSHKNKPNPNPILDGLKIIGKGLQQGIKIPTIPKLKIK